jgi:hypothetical protein
MQREETDAGLAVSREKAFYIIVKAREFDEKVAPSDPGSGSNPSDDKEVDILRGIRVQQAVTCSNARSAIR